MRYYLLALTLFHHGAYANIVPVTLSFESGSRSEITISASSGGSDTDTSNFGGTQSAEIHFNDDYSQITGIEFTSGNATRSPISLSFSTTLFVPAVGSSYFTTLTTTSSEIGFKSVSTGVGAVSTSGVLSNEPHSVRTFSGSITQTTKIPSLGVNESETTNFGTAPEEEPFEGKYLITNDTLSEIGGIRKVKISLSANETMSDSEAIPPSTTSFTFSETIAATASAIIEIDVSALLPNYTNAVAEAGFSGDQAAPDSDPLNRGIQNGLAYALKIPLTGELSTFHIDQLPRTLKGDTPNTAALGVTLPEELLDDVILRIMQSNALNGRDWTEVARKEGNADWTGSATVIESTPESGFLDVKIENTQTISAQPNSFMRLEVVVTE